MEYFIDFTALVCYYIHNSGEVRSVLLYPWVREGYKTPKRGHSVLLKKPLFY